MEMWNKKFKKKTKKRCKAKINFINVLPSDVYSTLYLKLN